MRGRRRYGALWVLPGLIASGLMLAGCTTEKCGPTPKILATWAGSKATIYQCGGGYGPIVGPPVGAAGATPQVVLVVGQELRLTEMGDWSTYAPVSGPLSDAPGVMRVVGATSGRLIGTFLAVAPGYADVGAHCAYGTCAFSEVQVVAPGRSSTSGPSASP
jgi:hypothetical protein